MYFQIPPNRILQEYVKYFWIFEENEPPSQVSVFKILPDGLPSLIYQDASNVFIDANSNPLPQLYIYGQFTKFSLNKATGPFRIIGAYFEPIALKALFGIDAKEFRNLNIPLDDLVSNSILEQLSDAKSSYEIVETLSDFLQTQILQSYSVSQNAKWALNLLQGGKSLKEVQEEMKISERSLERLANQYIGMNPKMYSRIMRFQNSLNLLKTAHFDSILDLALENEYFDQSHFNREFKEFAGITPSLFHQKMSEQLPNFPKILDEDDINSNI